MLVILDGLQAADGSVDRGQWCIDNWAAACAEVGGAQQVNSATASINCCSSGKPLRAITFAEAAVDPVPPDSPRPSLG